MASVPNPELPTSQAAFVLDRHARRIELVDQVAHGGEGTIWRSPDAGWLLKLYHEPTFDRRTKLTTMLKRPPADLAGLAWPEEPLFDHHGQLAGFAMREAVDALPFQRIYLPALRKSHKVKLDWRHMHAVALDLAKIMARVHAAGYVVGDLKPQNVVVDARARVTLLDTDSFQVPAPDGSSHRCAVGSEGFTPPELIGVTLAEVDQTPLHDAFRLGVAIYLLLFGRHPYQGVWQGEDDPPPLDELVRRGHWCHEERGPLRRPPGTPGLEVLDDGLAACFRACFGGQRPLPDAWTVALQDAVAALTPCAAKLHFQRPAMPCPWCAQARSAGVDIFGQPITPDPAPELALQAVVPAAVPSGPLFIVDPKGCTWIDGQAIPRPLPGDYTKGAVAYIGVMAVVAFLTMVCTGSGELTMMILMTLIGCSSLLLPGFVEKVEKEERLAREAQVLPGKIVDIGLCDGEHGLELRVAYSFTTPAGRAQDGSVTVVREDLATGKLPPVGTEIAIAYNSDITYRPL